MGKNLCSTIPDSLELINSIIGENDENRILSKIMKFKLIDKIYQFLNDNIESKDNDEKLEGNISLSLDLIILALKKEDFKKKILKKNWTSILISLLNNSEQLKSSVLILSIITSK